MYFIGIMIFLLIGNVILFVGNGLGDLCRWRDAKDNWNPYTQEKSKYWYDHKGRRRLVSNGKEYTNEQQHWDVVKKHEEATRNYNQEYNRLSKMKAEKEKKDVYECRGYDDLLKAKGIKAKIVYKDCKTDDVYVRRRVNYCYFWMNVNTGLYVKEIDDLNDDNTACKVFHIKKEDSIKMCEEHNKKVIDGKCISNDDYYDNKNYLIKEESHQSLSALQKEFSSPNYITPKGGVTKDTDYHLQGR